MHWQQLISVYVCACVCIKCWLLFPPCSQQGQRAHPDLLRPLSPVSHALWTLQGKILFSICQSCPQVHKTWCVLIKALFFLGRTPWEQPSRPTSPAGRCHPLKSWLPSVERTCQSRWITGEVGNELWEVCVRVCVGGGITGSPSHKQWGAKGVIKWTSMSQFFTPRIETKVAQLFFFPTTKRTHYIYLQCD